MKVWRLATRAALAGLALAAGTIGVRAETAADGKLQELDQKVRILERKLEIADEAAAAKAKESPTFSAGKDGFGWASADKGYSLKLRGYAQADGRKYLDDDDKKVADTFLLRRARVIIDGQVGKQFAFRIAPDFGGGSSQLQDGYLDYKSSPAFNLRFGRAKVPFGLERLQSSSETLFNEAGLPTGLTPNYDQGVQAFGSFAGGVLEYQVGVFNGGPDGASVDSDTNDDKDLAARLWVTPFKNSDIGALSGLSLGVAGTFGKQSGTTNAAGLPSFRTSGQQSFFSYKTSSNSADIAIADGDRVRLSPQFYYTAGALGLLGEYVIVEQDVANGKGSDSLKNESWQLAASYVLTGESPSLKGVKPASPFDPGAGRWGAWEIKARIGELTIDSAAFDKGYADIKRSAESAEAVGAGINWHLSGNARLSLDYEQTTFDGGASKGDRPEEKVVIARAQVSF